MIASTNKNLEDEIASGNFREDLFYRLNVVPFYVPPLRDRAEDIPVLAEAFLNEFSRSYGRKPKRLLPSALQALSAHVWPGNVRELRNLMERIAILHDREDVGAADLPSSNRRHQARQSAPLGFAASRKPASRTSATMSSARSPRWRAMSRVRRQRWEWNAATSTGRCVPSVSAPSHSRTSHRPARRRVSGALCEN